MNEQLETPGGLFEAWLELAADPDASPFATHNFQFLFAESDEDPARGPVTRAELDRLLSPFPRASEVASLTWPWITRRL